MFVPDPKGEYRPISRRLRSRDTAVAQGPGQRRQGGRSAQGPTPLYGAPSTSSRLARFPSTLALARFPNRSRAATRVSSPTTWPSTARACAGGEPNCVFSPIAALAASRATLDRRARPRRGRRRGSGLRGAQCARRSPRGRRARPPGDRRRSGARATSPLRTPSGGRRAP